MKLRCLKCGTDSFKVSLTEREIITETIPGRNKVNIIEMLHITCTECGWGKHLYVNVETPPPALEIPLVDQPIAQGS